MAEDFGGQLRRERVRHGVTQAELAAVVGVSAPTVCLWEQGKLHPPDDAASVLREVRGLPVMRPRRQGRPRRKVISSERRERRGAFERLRLLRRLGESAVVVAETADVLRKEHGVQVRATLRDLRATVDAQIAGCLKDVGRMGE